MGFSHTTTSVAWKKDAGIIDHSLEPSYPKWAVVDLYLRHILTMKSKLWHKVLILAEFVTLINTGNFKIKIKHYCDKQVSKYLISKSIHITLVDTNYPK